MIFFGAWIVHRMEEMSCSSSECSIFRCVAFFHSSFILKAFYYEQFMFSSWKLLVLWHLEPISSLNWPVLFTNSHIIFERGCFWSEKKNVFFSEKLPIIKKNWCTLYFTIFLDRIIEKMLKTFIFRFKLFFLCVINFFQLFLQCKQLTRTAGNNRDYEKKKEPFIFWKIYR